MALVLQTLIKPQELFYAWQFYTFSFLKHSNYIILKIVVVITNEQGLQLFML